MSMSILSGESWWSGEDEDYVDDDERDTSGTTNGSGSVFTVSTSYTTSSRTRRPGAAKARLASAKAAEQRTRSAASSHKNGWQESIQAAAALNDRVWERAGGWLDYDYDEKGEATTVEDDGDHDEEEPERAPASSNNKNSSSNNNSDKIHIPLHVFANKSNSRKNTLASRDNVKAKDTAKNGQGTTTAKDGFFPVEWGKEGKASIGSSTKIRQQQTKLGSKPPIPNKKTTKAMQQSPLLWDLAVPSAQDLSPPESPTHNNSRSKDQSVFRSRRGASLSPPRGQQKRATEPSYLSPPRNIQSNQQHSKLEITRSMSGSKKGWVETMREATANLARKGHSWDPKHGFSNLDAASASGVITLDSPNRSARNQKKAQSKDKQQQRQAERETLANVLEQLIAEQRKNDPPDGRNDPPGRKESTNHSSRNFSVDKKHDDSHNTHTAAIFLEKRQEQQQQQKEEYQEQLSSAEDLQSTIQEQIEVIFKSGASDPVKHRNYGIAALNFEEDEDYLLQVRAPVPVKIEKVGVEDMNLFRESSRQKNETTKVPQISPAGARSRRRENSPPVNMKPGVSANRNMTPTASVRRYTDPLDYLGGGGGAVSTASSDDTEETSNVWGGSAEGNDSFLQGSISSIVRRQAEQETKLDTEKRRARLSPRTTRNQNDNISWAAHAKRLSQNVRGSPELKKSPGSNNTVSRAMKKTENFTPDFARAAPVKEAANASIFREKDNSSNNNSNNNHSQISKRSGEVPGEIATDDASQATAQSSVTAGWKSFLNKKVQAETVAAAKLQEKVKEDPRDTSGKQMKIKKSVTFESESHMSDSLLDSLFDFSLSDVKSINSPERENVNDTGNRGEKPSSPYRQRLNEIKERRRNSPSRDRVQAQRTPPGSITKSSYGALADSPTRTANSSFITHGHSPNRNQNRSFQTDISPLTNMEEKVDQNCETIASERSSFLKRIAECRAPTVPTSRLAPPEQNHTRSMDEDAEETPVAYQWYLQSKQASEKVDEMLSFLRTREPISSCRQRASAKRSPAKNCLDPSPGQVDFTREELVQHQQDESEHAAEEAAKMLARARVQAMVGNLYYDSVDEKKGNI